MTNSLPAAPGGWILCRDPRLARLLETELAYLGVLSEVYPTLPPPAEGICVLVADGDEFTPEACATLAAACGCPLLILGRALTTHRAGEEMTHLRRPFGLAALETEIRLLLNRSAGNRPAGVAEPLIRHPAEQPASLPAETPPPTVTMEDGVVTVGTHTVALTPAETAILAYLLARPGETVAREELAPLLGGGGNIVDVYVCRLRAKIEKPLGRRMIRTVRGVGYVMEA